MRLLFSILVLFNCVTAAQSQNLDVTILRKVSVEGNENLDPTFRVLSKSVAPLCLAVPVGILSSHLINKDQGSKEKFIFVASSVLVCAAITNALKYSVRRTRPYDKYPDIEKEMAVHSPSFPSGHTSTAFALATSVSVAYPKWYVISASYLWAASVGYARIDLGVHYPSDVLAGAIIGAGSAYLGYRLNKWIAKRNSVKKTR